MVNHSNVEFFSQHDNSDVFLSFATPDYELAKKLHDGFEKVGLDCFLSSEDIAGGKQWKDEVIKHLTSSKATVLLLTENSLNRHWVIFEFGASYVLNKDIYPLLSGIEKKIIEESSLPIRDFSLIELSPTNQSVIIKGIKRNLLKINEKEEKVSFKNWHENRLNDIQAYYTLKLPIFVLHLIPKMQNINVDRDFLAKYFDKSIWVFNREPDGRLCKFRTVAGGGNEGVNDKALFYISKDGYIELSGCCYTKEKNIISIENIRELLKYYFMNSIFEFNRISNQIFEDQQFVLKFSIIQSKNSFLYEGLFHQSSSLFAPDLSHDQYIQDHSWDHELISIDDINLDSPTITDEIIEKILSETADFFNEEYEDLINLRGSWRGEPPFHIIGNLDDFIP